MGLLLVAWRYLVARPITLVSTASVMVGLVAIVVVDSVMNGFRAEQRSMIRAIAPDVSVDVSRLDAAASAALLAKVRAQPEVRSASGRVEVPALHHPSGSAPVLLAAGWADDPFVDVVGLEPSDAADAESLCRFTVAHAGDPFWFDRKDDYWTRRLDSDFRHRDDLVPILFGEDLARRVDYSPGKVVTLRTLAGDAQRDAKLTVQDVQCVVVGTFQTKDRHFDRTHALAPRDRLVDFAQLKTPMQEVAVSAASGVGEDALRDRLRVVLADGALSASAVETWADRKHLLLGAVETERRVMNVAMFFVVIVATFSLFVTLHQMVQRKTRDVGVLAAMGASPLDAGRVFLLCGTFVTVAGALLGLVGGLGLTRVLNPLLGAIERATGWTLFNRELFALDRLPIRVDFGRIVEYALGTIVCGTLFTLLPSLRAARLDPVEALRHE